MRITPLPLFLVVVLAACSSSTSDSGGGSGAGQSGSSGSTSSSSSNDGAGGSSSGGGSSSAGGSSSNSKGGGSSSSSSGSSSGGRSGSGGASSSASGSGGKSGGGSTSSGAGGASGSGSGGASSSSSGSTKVTAGSYALNPPKQCDNQTWVPDCQKGQSDTACGGICQAANACEDISSKPTGTDVGFLCPRFALFSDEMLQAAIDDFGDDPPFHYAVVGHDPSTKDGDTQTSCCQCYQIVYSLPEEEARLENDKTKSAIGTPKTLIVQAINTSAGGGDNFDVYMAAGGFGAFNACDASQSPKSASGLYLYSKFPTEGEPGMGGVNAATQITGCKNERNLVTSDTLSSSTCQTNTLASCNNFASTTLSSDMVESSKKSCLRSNGMDEDCAAAGTCKVTDYYHINWNMYVKKVECPTHLTEVTGCKLAAQGLPSPDKNVTTADAAAKDSSFRAGTTTTMQDCCKPTCAWQDYVTGNNGGLKAVDKYNSFYSCDQHGQPVTE